MADAAARKVRFDVVAEVRLRRPARNHAHGRIGPLEQRRQARIAFPHHAHPRGDQIAHHAGVEDLIPRPLLAPDQDFAIDRASRPQRINVAQQDVVGGPAVVVLLPAFCELAAHQQHTSKVLPRHRQRGIEVERLAQRGDCVVQLAQAPIGHAKIAVGLRIVRSDRQRLEKLRDGLRVASAVRERVAVVAQRLRIIRIEFDRRGIGRDRFWVAIHRVQRHAEIVVRDSRVWIEGDRLAMQLDRLLDAALFVDHHAQVGERDGIFGIEGERFAELGFREFALSGRVKLHAGRKMADEGLDLARRGVAVLSPPRHCPFLMAQAYPRALSRGIPCAPCARVNTSSAKKRLARLQT